MSCLDSRWVARERVHYHSIVQLLQPLHIDEAHVLYSVVCLGLMQLLEVQIGGIDSRRIYIVIVLRRHSVHAVSSFGEN
jgi:hypothetical protein